MKSPEGNAPGRYLAARCIISVFVAFFLLRFFISAPYLSAWYRALMVVQLVLSLVSPSAGLFFCLGNIPLHIKACENYGVPFFSVAQMLVMIHVVARMARDPDILDGWRRNAAGRYAVLWIAWSGVSAAALLLWLAGVSGAAILNALWENLNSFWWHQNTTFMWIDSVLLLAAAMALMMTVARIDVNSLRWMFLACIGSGVIDCLISIGRRQQVMGQSVYVANFPDRNSFAAFAAIMAIASWGLAARFGSRWIRALLFFAGLFFAATIIMSLSLSGVVGLAAAIITVGFVLLAHHGDLAALRRRIAWPAVLAAVVAAVLLISLSWTYSGVPQWPAVRGLKERVWQLEPAQLTEYVQANRSIFWRTALQAAASEPVSGIGPGNLYYQYPWWRKKIAVHRSDWWDPERENAHNYFLQMAAEIGWIGLVLTIAFFAALLRSAWRTGKRREKGMVTWSALLCGAIVVILTTSMTGHPLMVNEVMLLFGFVAGAVLALENQTSHQPATQKTLARRYIMSGAVALLVLAALLSGRSRDLQEWSDGFYDVVTENGVTYRCTRQVAMEQLRSRGNLISIPVRGVSREAVSGGAKVQVRVNNQTKDLILKFPEWQELSFTVADPIARITFVSSRRWNPKVEVKSPDWRQLGVEAGLYRWQTGSQVAGNQ